jgi:hypothetical protein
MPAASGTPRVVKKLALDEQVYASPIVVKGITVVATENDTVYAFNSALTLIWKDHLGTPSPASERPCGNIEHLGITGTPTYAGVTGLVYVAAEFSGNPPTHRLIAMRLTTGARTMNRHLDQAGVDQATMQERGALLTTSAGVYVPFGGLAGDCGAYKGRVLRYALDGTGEPTSYTVPTTREAGIWTPPGPTFDGTNLLVAVGNGESSTTYDYSDSVLKLSAKPALLDYFSPTNWAQENQHDVDLGSQGPAIVGPWVFQAGKSGTAYVLRLSSLGHIGGQVSSATVCASFGGTAVVGSTVYVPCTDGVRAVSIDSTGHMHVLWHAASNITGAPVVGGGRVWSLDTGAGVLHSLNPSTGAELGSVSVGAVTRFATPAIFGRNVYVPTTTGLTVVATS